MSGISGSSSPVKSIQRGVASLLNGDLTGNVSISAVDPAKSILTINEITAADAVNVRLYAYLANGTTITMERIATGGGVTSKMAWQLTEYN